MKKLLHEPLLYFLILGCAIFAVDYIADANAGSGETIVIRLDLQQELIDLFTQQRGRQPYGDERDALFRQWATDEILYREGLHLGLDRNDPVIRERIVDKMRFLYQHAADNEIPSDEELITWYRENLEHYRQPPRYDIEQVAVPAASDDPEAVATGWLSELGQTGETTGPPPGLHVLKQRSAVTLRAIYGEAYSQAISTMAVNQWYTVRSRKGWHVTRIVSKQAFEPPPFEEVKTRVLTDWRRERQQKRIENAIAALRQTYRIKIDG